MRSIGFILCFITAFLTTEAETSKKEYKCSFDKKEIQEVVVSNKNGTLEVEQSEQDSVVVSAVISLVAKTQSRADELIEYIQIKNALKEGFLNIETEFGKDMTFKQLLAGVELDISYKIRIPQGIKLRLINTDGNVFVDEYAGDLNVDMKSCNFRGGTIKEGEFYVKQTGGNFKVDDVAALFGEFKSCVVRIENGGDVKVVMNDCEGRFESVDKLDIRSSGGTMRFGQIEDMNGTSSSTKYEVQDIGNSLKMDMRMGEINVRNIHFNFSTVEIVGNYSKVGLSFMQGAGYQLELKHNKALKMDIPHSFKLSKQPTSEKNMLVETGFIGDKKYKGKVVLNLRYGNMYIQ